VATPSGPRPKVLGLVFLTALLDISGFSILFPLFPDMLAHYVEREGPGSPIGQLAAWLQELVGEGENASLLVHALFGGLLGSLYSILQFAFAPIWGALSDRHGRRSTILITLTGTVLSHVLWFFAGSFALLIVARLLGGLMAGNLSTVSAVVADTTTPRERSKGMGVMGAAIGLGFVLGPVLGGLSAQVDLTEVWPGGAALGVNPFSAPALVAFALASFNLLWAAARLPETHPPERRGHGGARSANPIALFTAVKAPGVRLTNLVYFLFGVAFSAIEFTLVFLAVERFAYTPKDNAWMFVFVGVLIALVQGGAVRRLAPRVGDRRLAWTGLVLVVPGFVLIGNAGGEGALYGGLAAMAVGSAFVMPTLSSLVSRYAPPERQGLALGTFRSLGALARSIGPALGGVIYWSLGSAAPYFLGAGFMVLPLAMALRLPLPRDGTPAEAPAGPE
jgi:MFS family permease